MKILFLDLDGALNSSQYMRANKEKWNSDKYCEMIDPKAVLLLNKIIKETNAEIVISSSWRLMFDDLNDLKEILVGRGLVGNIIDQTPTINPLTDGVEVHGNIPRGLEIQKWLRSAPRQIESFVILDDNSDMAHLSPFLVKTTWKYGLAKNHVKKAIEILKGIKK